MADSPAEDKIATPRKTAKLKIPAAAELEQSLLLIKGKIDSLVNSLRNTIIEPSDMANALENILEAGKEYRKTKILLEFEAALEKNINRITESGIDKIFITQATDKMRAAIEKRSFALEPERLTEIEEKLGIYDSGSDMEGTSFTNLKLVLYNLVDIDEIETVARKLLSGISAGSSKKADIKKEDALRHFIHDSGLEKRHKDLLAPLNIFSGNSPGTISAAENDQKVKGLVFDLAKDLNRRLSVEINRRMAQKTEKEVPVILKIISAYITGPVYYTATVFGTITLIGFGINKLAQGLFPESLNFLTNNEFAKALNSADTQTVLATGFTMIFIGGIVKLLDLKITGKK